MCENKDFCGIVMPSEKDNILKLSQYMKSDKTPYIKIASRCNSMLHLQERIHTKVC